MTTTTRTVPLYLGVRLPPELAASLRKVSYETGRSKTDLVIEALRNAYGTPQTNGDAAA